MPKSSEPENSKHFSHQPTEQFLEKELENSHTFTPSIELNSELQGNTLDHNLQSALDNECGNEFTCSLMNPQPEQTQTSFEFSNQNLHPEISNTDYQEKVLETKNSLEPLKSGKGLFGSTLSDTWREDEHCLPIQEGNMEKHITEKKDQSLTLSEPSCDILNEHEDNNSEPDLRSKHITVASEQNLYNESEICDERFGHYFTMEDQTVESSKLPMEEIFLEDMKLAHSKISKKCLDGSEDPKTNVQLKQTEENIQEEAMNYTDTNKKIKVDENGSGCPHSRIELSSTGFNEEYEEEQQSRKCESSSGYSDNLEYSKEKQICPAEQIEENHQTLGKEDPNTHRKDSFGDKTTSEQQVENSYNGLRVFGQQVSRVK